MMKNSKLGWRPILQVLVVSAAAFLVCGAAQAQVKGFVVVNPIVVCESGGTNCAPFGVICSTNLTTGVYSCKQSGSPSAATVNTPIGFVDGDRNINVTRAILAAQAGIDVAFFPVQQYNSPNTNTDPWPKISPAYTISSPNLPNYQHLHIKNVTCKDGVVVQASPDLAALTQHQICTEHKGVPAGVPTNPPPSPSPAPPLGSSLGKSNALDLFFVKDFDQPVFGVSWINGDGVAIAGPATFLVTGPRFDNLAHEIGHALGLDHNFGVTTNLNMMANGTSRFVPSSSGCSTAFAIPPVTGGFSNPNFGVLYDLGSPLCNPTAMPSSEAEQLTVGGTTCTDLSTCTSQVGAVSISPFVVQTLASTATAGGGAQTAATTLATTTSTTLSTDVPFEVDAPPGTGENGDSVNSIIIALPDISGLTFSGSSPATQTGGSGGVNIISQVRLNGNSGVGNPNCVKSINLAPPSVQCLQIFFSTGDAKGNAFVAGDSVTFNLALNKPNTTIVQNGLLNNTQFTVVTSTANTPTAYSTTSTLGQAVPNGPFTADSRFPDLTTPNQINPNFVNSAVVRLGPQLSKCTPPYTGSGPHQQCMGTSTSAATQCAAFPPGTLACSD